MMTTLDDSICWAVLAPLSTSELERVAAREWKRDRPYAIDPPPWESVAGARDYNGLVSPFPGTEGSDRHFAEIFSRLAGGHAVYALWLDPENRRIFEWKKGREVASRTGDPLELAESLGFAVAQPASLDADVSSVAIVENASVEDVRRALGDMAGEAWLHLTPSETGVLITADDGPLGTQAWDVAEVLPAATVYFVLREPAAFSVRVLRGAGEIGWFRVPPLDSDAPMLPDIKGARSPSAILKALGIPSEALGRGREVARESPPPG